ncbi:MAG: phosphoribosylaminoimidazolesuccinocarboxamide synthase [Dehalococcoidia bacterium]|nr:phosphoribosylaminoimidazolesuccinocarboxamide synthase [Dehalococcoidia bacterium]
MPVLLETQLPNLYARGKVRDTYDVGDGRLLMVTTDRISAFDVVLPNGIPDKGAVLTQLSGFWFGKTAGIVPNHLLRIIEDTKAPDLPLAVPPELVGRSMLVKKAERIDIECVARGYLSGSAWVEYQETGRVCGVALPEGLRESDQLPQPIFTPATKAESGHDINISYDEVAAKVGPDLAEQLRDTTLAVYRYAAGYARRRGIIIADTKMEFGRADGQLILIDELLTPDSSRFWSLDTYEPGKPQPSFDKQPVRDWLIRSGWNREPPAPELPPKIVAETSERYKEAFRRLTGREIRHR